MERKDMTIYNTVDDYLKNFKVGDRIVLGPFQSKHDTYTVTERTTSTHLSLKEYKKRAYLSLNPAYYDQRIAVIPTETFKNLPN